MDDQPGGGREHPGAGDRCLRIELVQCYNKIHDFETVICMINNKKKKKSKICYVFSTKYGEKCMGLL